MKYLVTFILLVSFNLSNGQTSYTSANYLKVDDTLLFSSTTQGITSIDFDTTGENMHWDFSDLNYTDQQPNSYFPPEESGYMTSWCFLNGHFLNCNSAFANLTNLATENLDKIDFGTMSIENVVSHELKNETSLQATLLGITAVIEGTTLPLAFAYENADTLYRFPLNYNASDSSTSRIKLDFSPAPFIQSRNNKRINHVEGWGSLTTPYGTFEEVLKMKTTIINHDTLFLDSLTIPTSTTAIEYKWWSPDYGLPVVTASGTKTGNNITITGVSYLDSSRCVTPNPVFIYLPFNPIFDTANKSADVQFTNLSSDADSIFWDFGDGTNSDELNPAHTFTSADVFSVELHLFNKCEAGIVGNSLSVPVVVTDTSTSINGLNESISHEIQLYPNPTTGEINVDMNLHDIESVDIINSAGQSVMQFKNWTPDVSHLEDGIYTLKITTRKGIKHARFIKTSD